MAERLTYSQQLADPRWQRRRLEMLEAAGWSCGNCASETWQLHVHHPRYIKGRMAWEYYDDELEVLCAECHEAHHRFERSLSDATHTSVFGHRLIDGISAGFLHAALDLDLDTSELIEAVCPDAMTAGHFAYMFFYASRVDKQRIAAILAQADDPRNPVENETIERLGGYDRAQ